MIHISCAVDPCQGSTCNGHGECVTFNGAPVCRCDDSSFGPETGELALQCSQHTCDGGVVCLNGGVCNGYAAVNDRRLDLGDVKYGYVPNI